MAVHSSSNTLRGEESHPSPHVDARQTDVESNIHHPGSRKVEFEVVLDDDDPKNPKNWSLVYRAWVIVTVAFSAWVVVLYSTSYMSSAPGLESELGVSSLGATTGLTTYLLGLALGSLFSAPLSELYGRRIVYILSLGTWILLIIPCGLAESFAVILASRFFGGVAAAALVSNGPGSIVDVSKPDQLALGMSLYSLGPFSGPVLGPFIGGVVFQYLNRRWTNWIVLALGGLAFLMMLTVEETYIPHILRRETSRLRGETGDSQWWCQYDRQVSAFHSLRVSLYRPVVLFITEPTILLINTWYDIFSMLFICLIFQPN
jgi:multidrug resistance protein